MMAERGNAKINIYIYNSSLILIFMITFEKPTFKDKELSRSYCGKCENNVTYGCVYHHISLYIITKDERRMKRVRDAMDVHLLLSLRSMNDRAFGVLGNFLRIIKLG
jgi:hypothetical protein